MSGTDDGPAEEGATDDPEADLDAVLDDLFAVVEARKRDLPEGSYTASLFTHEKGENAVLEKLGEETTELLLAARDEVLPIFVTEDQANAILRLRLSRLGRGDFRFVLIFEPALDTRFRLAPVGDLLGCCHACLLPGLAELLSSLLNASACVARA